MGWGRNQHAVTVAPALHPGYYMEGHARGELSFEYDRAFPRRPFMATPVMSPKGAADVQKRRRL